MFVKYNVLIFCLLFTSTICANATNTKTELNFQSAKNCSNCHKLIYDEWRSSWMSKAFTNEVFQADWARFRILAKNTGQSPASCLRCHAPAAIMTSDNSAKQMLSEEGVNCEICHKVAMVKKRGDRYHLVIDPGNTQYGRNKVKAESASSHAIKTSKAFNDSTLCAGCHLDIQDTGIALERTYQEWANSNYKKQGLGCSKCHMPKVPGLATTANQIAQTNTENTHASHRFPGGHFGSSLLQGAAGLKLNYDKEKQKLFVHVINHRVGHNFPTGGAHPAELILELNFIDANKKSIHQLRTIFKAALPIKSNITSNTTAAKNQATQDTTLKPQENRKETYNLSGLPLFKSIEAKLTYYLLPEKAKKHFNSDLLQTSYRPSEIAKCTLDLTKNNKTKKSCTP